MKKIIIQTLQTLLTEFQNASDFLGIQPQNMIQTWCPEYTVGNLQTDEIHLALFLQDCQTDTEEARAGVMKTIFLRVAILKKVSSLDDEGISQAVECFEQLQNFLTGFRSWKASDSQEFTITKASPAEIAEPETLKTYLTAECGFDLEVQTFVHYE